MTVPLAESYRQCRLVLRRASTNFYLSFCLVTPARRKALTALYAFARHTDDLGDGAGSAIEREQALRAWRAAVAEALAGESASPLLPALVDTVERFQVPHRHLFEVIDGVLMDMHHQGYETFDELEGYCYHVASAVGLACLPIWGCRDEAARAPAVKCGLAFQLTNILRDVGEDLQLGRVYLPREEMRRFDLTEDDLRTGSKQDRLRELIAFQVSRAESFYRQSAETARFLSPDSRRMFSVMFNTYRTLLHEIARRPDEILKRRIRLSLPRKLAIAMNSCLRGVGRVDR